MDANQLPRPEEEIADLQQQVLALMAENARQRAGFAKENQELRNQMLEYQRVADYNLQLRQDMENSRAWKLTKPLRWLRGKV